jgi:hypothetical protein
MCERWLLLPDERTAASDAEDVAPYPWWRPTFCLVPAVFVQGQARGVLSRVGDWKRSATRHRASARPD